MTALDATTFAAPDLTGLLRAWGGGDESARDAVIPLVYATLRQIARNRIRREGDAISLDATGLAHEAYLRIGEQRGLVCENRQQFFALAARIMRRHLVDRYRARLAQKRGGAITRLALHDMDLPSSETPDLLALNAALDRLQQQDARQAQLVELRFFAGLSIPEIAEALALSPATVKREWALARVWLKREIERDA
jgi:RNA polymerase sigma factor (TIGR02999 family)